ncbi:hypothetical protein BN946_scf184640.g16 [Trametes cinnabarina]|uniref:non-specific serine/threonine protein kinase n=1 Tax=Pycnoporus cinnabarinus TaxID=5643 RepID=A0A060SLI1_PYCCI|nr:hypothetical protein BN946_scf184640.g16 [Trametes cinnabarina]
MFRTMSIFQTFFSRIVPGCLTSRQASSEGALLKSGSQPPCSDDSASSTMPSPSSSASSRLPWPVNLSLASFQEEHWEHAERHYGLGIIVAKAIGLSNPLRLLSHSVKLAAVESSSHACAWSDTRTPSPLCFTGPETPASAGCVDSPSPGFARSTPSKIHWIPSPISPTHCNGTRAVSPAADPTTWYISALQAYYGIPTPRLNHVIIPSYESFHGSAEQADTILDPVASSARIDTVPAWSTALRDTSPAADADLAVDERDSVHDSHSGDYEVRGEVEGAEDVEVDLSCVYPYHPDGTVYHLLGQLGQGGFGRVMLAATSAGELVALKVVHKPLLYDNGGVRDSLITERDMMAMATKYKLPFLMHLKAAWEEGDNVYFAMELCGEDLRSRIKRAVRSGLEISPREAKLLCMEMLSCQVFALVDLDILETIHGDIKPDNFLITKSGRIVLSDLGGAQCVQALDHDFDPRVTPFHEWDAPYSYGTPGYYAPEVLCQERGAKDAKFTSKVDVFSLGLVFVELLCGLEVPLWDTQGEPQDLDVDMDAWRAMDHSERQAARMMTEGLRKVLERDGVVDDDARDLVCQMLRPDPKDRPTPCELLHHRYFHDLDMQAVRSGLVPRESSRDSP